MYKASPENEQNQNAFQCNSENIFTRQNMSSTPCNLTSTPATSPTKTSTTSVLRRWRRPESQDGANKLASKDSSAPAAAKCVKFSSPLNIDNKIGYSNADNNSQMYSLGSQGTAGSSSCVQYSEASSVYSRTSPALSAQSKIIPDKNNAVSAPNPYYNSESVSQEAHFRSPTYPVQNTPPLAHSTNHKLPRDYSYQNYMSKSPTDHRINRDYSLYAPNYPSQKINQSDPKLIAPNIVEDVNYCLQKSSAVYGSDNRISPNTYPISNSTDRKVNPKSPVYKTYPIQNPLIPIQNYASAANVNHSNNYCIPQNKQVVDPRCVPNYNQNYAMIKNPMVAPVDPKHSREYRSMKKNSPTYPILEQRLNQSELNYCPPDQPNAMYYNKYSAPIMPHVNSNSKIIKDSSHDYIPHNPMSSNYPFQSKFYPPGHNLDWKVHREHEQNLYLSQMNQMQTRLPNCSINKPNEIPRELSYADPNHRLMQKGRLYCPTEINQIEHIQYPPKPYSVAQKPSSGLSYSNHEQKTTEHSSNEYLNLSRSCAKPDYQFSPVIQSSKPAEYNYREYQMHQQLYRPDLSSEQQNYMCNVVGQNTRNNCHMTYSRQSNIKVNEVPPSNISPRRTFQENMPVMVYPPQFVGLQKSPSIVAPEYQQYSTYSAREAIYPGYEIKPGISQQPTELYPTMNRSQQRYPFNYTDAQYYQQKHLEAGEKMPYCQGIDYRSHYNPNAIEYMQQNPDRRYENCINPELQNCNVVEVNSTEEEDDDDDNEAKIKSLLSKKDSNGKSLKEFLESWEEDEEIVSNLPDLVLCNNIFDKQKQVLELSTKELNADNNHSPIVPTKSSQNEDNIKNATKLPEVENVGESKQKCKEAEPLYILGSTSISKEALPHYLAVYEQFDKLPDNIKGYYKDAVITSGDDTLSVIVENEIIPTNSEKSVEKEVIKDCDLEEETDEVLNLCTNKNSDNNEFLVEEYSNTSEGNNSASETEKNDSIESFHEDSEIIEKEKESNVKNVENNLHEKVSEIKYIDKKPDDTYNKENDNIDWLFSEVNSNSMSSATSVIVENQYSSMKKSEDNKGESTTNVKLNESAIETISATETVLETNDHISVEKDDCFNIHSVIETKKIEEKITLNKNKKFNENSNELEPMCLDILINSPENIEMKDSDDSSNFVENINNFNNETTNESTIVNIEMKEFVNLTDEKISDKQYDNIKDNSEVVSSNVEEITSDSNDKIIQAHQKTNIEVLDIFPTTEKDVNTFSDHIITEKVAENMDSDANKNSLLHETDETKNENIEIEKIVNNHKNKDTNEIQLENEETEFLDSEENMIDVVTETNAERHDIIDDHIQNENVSQIERISSVNEVIIVDEIKPLNTSEKSVFNDLDNEKIAINKDLKKETVNVSKNIENNENSNRNNIQDNNNTIIQEEENLDNKNEENENYENNQEPENLDNKNKKNKNYENNQEAENLDNKNKENENYENTQEAENLDNKNNENENYENHQDNKNEENESCENHHEAEHLNNKIEENENCKNHQEAKHLNNENEKNENCGNHQEADNLDNKNEEDVNENYLNETTNIDKQQVENAIDKIIISNVKTLSNEDSDNFSVDLQKVKVEVDIYEDASISEVQLDSDFEEYSTIEIEKHEVLENIEFNKTNFEISNTSTENIAESCEQSKNFDFSYLESCTENICRESETIVDTNKNNSDNTLEAMLNSSEPSTDYEEEDTEEKNHTSSQTRTCVDEYKENGINLSKNTSKNCSSEEITSNGKKKVEVVENIHLPSTEIIISTKEKPVIIKNTIVKESPDDDIILSDNSSCVLFYGNDEYIIITDEASEDETIENVVIENTEIFESNIEPQYEEVIVDENVSQEVTICDNEVEDWDENEEILLKDTVSDKLEEHTSLQKEENLNNTLSSQNVEEFKEQKSVQEQDIEILKEVTESFLNEERCHYFAPKIIEKRVDDKELFINPENPAVLQQINTYKEISNANKVNYEELELPKIEFQAPKRRYSYTDSGRYAKKPLINLDEISKNITEVLESLTKTDNIHYQNIEKDIPKKTPLEKNLQNLKEKEEKITKMSVEIDKKVIENISQPLVEHSKLITTSDSINIAENLIPNKTLSQSSKTTIDSNVLTHNLKEVHFKTIKTSTYSNNYRLNEPMLPNSILTESKNPPIRKIKDPRLERIREEPKIEEKPSSSSSSLSNKLSNTFGLTEYTKNYIKMKTGQVINPPINNSKRVDSLLSSNSTSNSLVTEPKNNNTEKSNEKKVKINLQDYRKRKLSQSFYSLDTKVNVPSSSSSSIDRLEKNCNQTKTSLDLDIEDLSVTLDLKNDVLLSENSNSVSSNSVLQNFSDLEKSASTSEDASKTILKQKSKKRKRRFRNLYTTEEEDEEPKKLKNNLKEKSPEVEESQQPPVCSSSIDERSKISESTNSGVSKNVSCCLDLNSNKKSELKCGLTCHKNNSNSAHDYKVNKDSSHNSNLKLTLKKNKPAFADVLSSLDSLVATECSSKKQKKQINGNSYSSVRNSDDALWMIKNKVPKVIIKRNGSGYCAVFRDISSNPIWQPKIRLKRQQYIESLLLDSNNDCS